MLLFPKKATNKTLVIGCWLQTQSPFYGAFCSVGTVLLPCGNIQVFYQSSNVGSIKTHVDKIKRENSTKLMGKFEYLAKRLDL